MRRPRRNRKSPVIREMIQENSLSISDLIYPMFVTEGEGRSIPIDSMPGISRLSLDLLLKDIEDSMELGLASFCLFPAISDNLKNKKCTEAFREDGLYLKTLRTVKEKFPEAVVMTDVALDPYSSDGHDGLVENGKILNDESVELLTKMALYQAQAGADIIGPSDMMDGRVGAIRETLDDHSFTDVSIMSYTAKYASAFYGPFRDALDSAPKEGDKKAYQMDPANRNEAMVEAELDFQEGADFLMVKPALSYLDIISDLKSNFQTPIAAYNVSGEYAMVKAAGEKGWIDADAVALETLLSMKRAGADIILSYFAKEVASKI